jgi:hypothetical protein
LHLIPNCDPFVQLPETERQVIIAWCQHSNSDRNSDIETYVTLDDGHHLRILAVFNPVEDDGANNKRLISMVWCVSWLGTSRLRTSVQSSTVSKTMWPITRGSSLQKLEMGPRIRVRSSGCVCPCSPELRRKCCGQEKGETCQYRLVLLMSAYLST